MEKPSFDLAREQYDIARNRALLRRIWSAFTGTPNDLLDFENVRQQIKASPPVERGIEAVPIARIVGSVNRYQDFDRVFLPSQTFTRQRWERVEQAYYDAVNLPPVELYKIGSIYFVVDGNHRVSVARQLGLEFIDAHVQECRVRVPITEKLAETDLSKLSGKADFLQYTHLDETRPEVTIECTIEGGYYRLIEHIEVHRYLQSTEWKREFSTEEAAAQWADQVYLPLVTAIRDCGIMQDFPRNTETDLYLWVIEHQYFLREQLGEVSAADAARHYADHNSQRPLRRFLHFLTHHLLAAKSRETLTNFSR